MSELLIGTEDGLFRLGSDRDGIHPEDGPPSAAFLARGAAGNFAITVEGALWEKASTRDWQLVNSNPVAEDVWAFAADARLAGRLYLGVSPALLYRSDDGGKSWAPCDAIKQIPGYEQWTFPPPPHIPHVRSIAPDPRAAGAVYIGVEEGGVFWSPDGGESWESLNEGLYWDVHTVTPTADGSTLYATTGRGFHRSHDRGRHWEHITTGLDRGYTVPFIAPPQHAGLLYTAAAATPPPGWREGGANAALYRSRNGGQDWDRLETGLPPRFDTMVRQLAADDAGVVYAAAGDKLFAGQNEGENWEMVADQMPVRALAIV